MTEMICAGFGGQGVLTTGLIVAEAAMKLGNEITWYPSYGSEMRGGTANCTIKVDRKAIASPYSKHPDILLAMNGPAIDKFEQMLKPGAYLFVNASLVPEDRTYREDINLVKVPMEEIAQKCENPKGANLVMLGAMCRHTGLFGVDELDRLVAEYFAKKGKVNPKNSECLRAGAEL